MKIIKLIYWFLVKKKNHVTHKLIVFVPADESAREKAQNKERVLSDSETDGKNKYRIDIQRV